MCGIVALLNLDGRPVDPAVLQRMRDSMRHRGPNDAGLWVHGAVGLGHRRLSILDLSPSGHQPMCNEDGTIWLIFNGEIYNYVELAAELRQRGHGFRSGTDSEVIVHLYEEEGAACVDRLRGMFGFVIWDARTHTLFAARDRAGVKPLYYTFQDGRFACASEIKALLEDPQTPRRPDPQGIAAFLFAESPLAERTTFAGIRQLSPGHCLTIRGGQLSIWKYWDVNYRYDHGRSHAESAAVLYELLDETVRIHTRSDAPLGAHLSGGLDSSTVASLAARHRSPLPTFSIRFSEGWPYDESRYARAVAAFAGTRHVEDTPSAPELGRLLPPLIWHMDMPMPNVGGFAYFVAARLARRHVTVSLTGHGGDEIFGGYPAQFQAAFNGVAFLDHPAMTVPARPPLSTRLRRVLQRDGLSGVVRRLLARARRGRGGSLEDRWVQLHCGPTPDANPWLHARFLRDLGGYSPRADYLRPFVEAPTDSPFDRCLYHDLRCYLPTLLHMEDRASMAVSLESRVPLLDHRVIEFLATVPPEQKVPEGISKQLLRTAMTGRLPEEVLARRDKGPFLVPTGAWFDTTLAPLVRKVLHSPACLDRGVLDPDHLRNQPPAGSNLWMLLNLELWFRIFIDQDPEWVSRTGAIQEDRAGLVTPPSAA